MQWEGRGVHYHEHTIAMLCCPGWLCICSSVCGPHRPQSLTVALALALSRSALSCFFSLALFFSRQVKAAVNWCALGIYFGLSLPLSLSFGPSPPPSLFVLDWANASGVILSPPCFCLLHLDSLWGITKVLSDPVRLGPVCPPL